MTGHIHSGTPMGEMTTLGGVSMCESKPKEPSVRALLFLSDACGHAFINNQLLADGYTTEGGYHVFMPDLFHGDPHGFGRDDISVYEWLTLHPPDRVEPVINTVLAKIKSSGDRDHKFKTVCTVGFCTGAKYVTRLLGREDSGIAAAYEAHLSFMSVEELRAVKRPLSIAAAGKLYTILPLSAPIGASLA
ncbi:conserved hypothetical protein [Talaromyces marneffei ATCC 18224]|uniref:Dienelactone hydrolase domain-containing protein n=1 Tax=Talaromyces marneffei (strain ATCC 18224 / CBS 334.59 / QM 7333) TaxID=441960 RepID=B6Q9H2_TALMQ|nr:conserved hypothetical protein [Talaromyces marneffei ATCC 18224]